MPPSLPRTHHQLPSQPAHCFPCSVLLTSRLRGILRGQARQVPCVRSRQQCHPSHGTSRRPLAFWAKVPLLVERLFSSSSLLLQILSDREVSGGHVYAMTTPYAGLGHSQPSRRKAMSSTCRITCTRSAEERRTCLLCRRSRQRLETHGKLFYTATAPVAPSLVRAHQARTRSHVRAVIMSPSQLENK